MWTCRILVSYLTTPLLYFLEPWRACTNSADVCIRQHTSTFLEPLRACTQMYQMHLRWCICLATPLCLAFVLHTSAYVSIRQHTCICLATPLCLAFALHTSAYASIRQHTPAYVRGAYFFEPLRACTGYYIHLRSCILALNLYTCVFVLFIYFFC